MGGRRTTQEELQQLEAMTQKGLTTRQIALKLGRSEAGIRNLRYRKRLVKKAENETEVLFQQRNKSKNRLQVLRAEKTLLTYELNRLKKEKEKLEANINVDKTILRLKYLCNLW